MQFFYQIHAHKHGWYTFPKILEKNYFRHCPKIFTYDVIFAPKMTKFWQFSPKMTYFDQIDPINDVFN